MLEQLDGFDGAGFAWPNGEDTDLGLRAVKAGFRDRYVADALMWHDVGASEFRAHWRRIPRLDGIVTLVSAPSRGSAEHERHHLPALGGQGGADRLGRWCRAGPTAPGPARLDCSAPSPCCCTCGSSTSRTTRLAPIEEWAKAIPQGFVADSWAVVVMIRSSIRHRTLLL